MKETATANLIYKPKNFLAMFKTSIRGLSTTINHDNIWSSFSTYLQSHFIIAQLNNNKRRYFVYYFY